MGKKKNASLGVIFGIVVLDLLGFGILIPQLGLYGVKFNGSPFVIGLLLSVYSLMQFLFAPVLGRLSDRYGRRPVLLYSLAGSFAGYLLFAFAGSLSMLFVARVVDGISGANVSTAQAYVADVTTPENRAKGMGMVGAAFGIGFLLGPGIGGLLGHLGGNLAIGLGAAALSGVNLVAAALFLPESRRPDSPEAQRRSITGVVSQLKLPVVGLVLVSILLFTTAFSQMEGTLSVFLLTQHLAPGLVEIKNNLFLLSVTDVEADVRSASLKVSYLFVAVGVVSVVIQGKLIGPLKKRFGEATLGVLGMIAATIGLGLIPVAPTYGWFFLPVAFLALGSSLVNPSLSALLSVHTPANKQGEVLGAYQSMGALGRIIGPALGGLLFTLVSPGMPYWVAAAMLAIGVLVALRLSRAVKT